VSALIISDEMECILKQLVARTREEALEHLVSDLEKLLADSDPSSGAAASPFVTRMVARGIEPPTIAWVVLQMLGDLTKRGWLTIGYEPPAARDALGEIVEPLPEAQDAKPLFWLSGLTMMGCLESDADIVIRATGCALP